MSGVQQIPGAIVVLTADHGGADFPERSAERGFPHAHRVPVEMMRGINAELRTRFNLDFNPIHSGSSGLIVSTEDDVALADPLRGQIADAAVELLSAQPDVQLAVRREVILAMPEPESLSPESLSLPERLRLSAVEGRSPDIFVVWTPGVVAGGSLGGSISTHGSVWDYDRRVPILLWWPGATGQERFLPVRTIDIAPSLANVMGVTAPTDLDGRCMDLGVSGAPTCPAP